MKEGTELKERREKLGYTQEQVAEKAGISLRAYKMYESGERIPRADVMSRIAKVLRTSVERLLKT